MAKKNPPGGFLIYLAIALFATSFVLDFLWIFSKGNLLMYVAVLLQVSGIICFVILGKLQPQNKRQKKNI
ncbi:hypothetical protein KRX54_02390 [Actinomycetaceae bacterium TAE3-ERU4]|nr:hypothetical protein [Actinomycetaceae bacterium TAE3-ERU4]